MISRLIKYTWIFKKLSNNLQLFNISRKQKRKKQRKSYLYFYKRLQKRKRYQLNKAYLFINNYWYIWKKKYIKTNLKKNYLLINIKYIYNKINII